MYPTSAADDARCEDFSISLGHKPAVPMITVADECLVGLGRCARYACIGVVGQAARPLSAGVDARTSGTASGPARRPESDFRGLHSVPERGGAHSPIVMSGLPFSTTYVASYAASPLPTFFTAWIALAATVKASPAVTVVGMLSIWYSSAPSRT
jgi:hypothetical protein